MESAAKVILLRFFVSQKQTFHYGFCLILEEEIFTIVKQIKFKTCIK